MHTALHPRTRSGLGSTRLPCWLILAGVALIATACSSAPRSEPAATLPAADTAAADRGASAPASQPRGSQAAAPLLPIEIVTDPILAYRTPAYAIAGRPMVLFPSPPRGLIGWWLPPTPQLRTTESQQPLEARLYWLAGSASSLPHDDYEAWLPSTGRWSALPAARAEQLARSTAAADRTQLGEAGLWIVLVDGLSEGETLEAVDASESIGQRIEPRWLPATPTWTSDLAAAHPAHWITLSQRADDTLARSLAGAWRDPMQRWRFRLLADRFAALTRRPNEPETPAGTAIVDELAAQFERLWREGLSRLADQDPALASDVLSALLPIAEVAPGRTLPLWQPSPEAEWQLLATLLDESPSQARLAAFVRAFIDARPAMLSWIAQDATTDAGAFDAMRTLVGVAELQGRPRRVSVQAAQAPGPAETEDVLGLSVIELAVSLPAADEGSQGSPRQLVVRSGALRQPLVVAPAGAAVTPPGHTISALWSAWSARSWLASKPVPAAVVRDNTRVAATAAILTHDDVQSHWVLFVECLREPGTTIEHDELRVWFSGAEPIILLADGQLTNRNTNIEATLLDHQSRSDRWSATLALHAPSQTSDNSTVPFAAPVRLAMQRTQRLAGDHVRVSSWPRPRLPGDPSDTPPGSFGLDLTAWHKALEGAEGFDLLRRDVPPASRDAFDAWRSQEPLP